MGRKKSKVKTRLIKSWMVRVGLTQRMAGAELGMSQSYVSRVVRGHYTGARVLEYFLSKGCPVGHLGLDQGSDGNHSQDS